MRSVAKGNIGRTFGDGKDPVSTGTNTHALAGGGGAPEPEPVS